MRALFSRKSRNKIANNGAPPIGISQNGPSPQRQPTTSVNSDAPSRPAVRPAPRAETMPGGSPDEANELATGSDELQVFRATTTAPVNIAVVKYWGKRDKRLNLPSNSSISVTLNQEDLRTVTTASCSPDYPCDSLTLNNVDESLNKDRTQACLRELRARRQHIETYHVELTPLSTYPLRIVSVNNFPTAAGLASSASGFAALVRAIAELYELPISVGDLSRIARKGSGSACRSLFGGYVSWNMGSLPDGLDSMASQIAPAASWPTMRALILVVSATRKDVPSTDGMKRTVDTSPLFKTRANVVVPQHMHEMNAAIAMRDFGTFGRLTMVESNNFHATCADSFPPIFYLNDISRAVIKAVDTINDAEKKIVAAYTFDAGPNAVVLYEEQKKELIHATFKALVGHVKGWNQQLTTASANTTSTSPIQMDQSVVTALNTGISQVILTSVGEGPKSLPDHLVDVRGNIIKT